jgi:hypothetical protein
MIGRTPIINDDGTCTTGTVWDNAWKQELYEQIDVFVGKWYPITFDAANFYSTGTIWTVTAAQVKVNRAVLAGNTLLWNVMIDASSINGIVSNLYLVIPYGLTAIAASQGLATAYDGGAGWFYCNVTAAAASNNLTISKLDFSNFVVNNNTTYLRFKTWIDVNLGY